MTKSDYDFCNNIYTAQQYGHDKCSCGTRHTSSKK